MTLPTGTRLTASDGASYDILGHARDGARHAYYRARRGFRNFRYPSDALEDAPDAEALEVLVRVPLPGQGEVLSAKFEREAVLAAPGMPWFSVPIDWVDPPPGGAPGPCLVLADPHARVLEPGGDPGWLVEVLGEVLGMLESLLTRGLVVETLHLEDFWVDEAGRWFFLGTDLVRPATGSEGLVAWERLADGWLGADPAGPGGWRRPSGAGAEVREHARRLRERSRAGLRSGEPGAPLARLRGFFRGRRG